jgi:hypothetical protein
MAKAQDIDETVTNRKEPRTSRFTLPEGLHPAV